MKKLSTLLIAILVSLPRLVSACPNCVDALKDDPAARAFYWSTLFLVATPFTVLSTAGGSIAYFYWRAARRRRDSMSVVSTEKE